MTHHSEVDDAITGRHSVRAFTPQPVPRDMLESILEVASRAPSGTNTQPWKVYVLQGHKRNALVQDVCAAIDAVHADEVAACSVEIAVITAGGSVRQALPFTGALNLEHCAPMAAGGVTPLGQAVEQGLDLLEQRKAEYRRNGVAYYQPWVVLISDGSPTDSWQAVAQRTRQLAEQRKLVSLPIGVSGADMGILGQFSNRPAVALQGLQFRDFFLWLSASMSRVSQSASTTASITLPSMDGWASI